MRVKENYSFYENYTGLFYEGCRGVGNTIEQFNKGHPYLSEVIKILAAGIFLQILATNFITPNSELSATAICTSVVIAPVVEEIFFRGVLLKFVYLCQRKPQTPEEEGKQRAYRIHSVAFIFGFLHWPLGEGPINAVLAYFGGVSYGWLAEKHQTLSLIIVAHGINNFLVMKALTSSPKSAPGYAALLLATHMGIYLWSTHNVHTNKASSPLPAI